MEPLGPRPQSTTRKAATHEHLGRHGAIQMFCARVKGLGLGVKLVCSALGAQGLSFDVVLLKRGWRSIRIATVRFLSDGMRDLLKTRLYMLPQGLAGRGPLACEVTRQLLPNPMTPG